MPDDLDMRARYRAELRESAYRYQQRDKAGYAAILEQAMRGYTGQPEGDFKRRMHAVNAMSATANHFPEYDAWLSTRSPESAPE